MGITFVEKGGDRRRTHAKTALVLAGGAISGGAFKIGGLIALNAFLDDRSVCDFDTYVGISAGAFLAAPLAVGVQPEELLRSIEGRSRRISQFTPTHFYLPNWREFIGKPVAFSRDAIGLVPAVSMTIAGLMTSDRSRMINLARRFLEEPSVPNAEQLVLPMVQAFGRHSRLQRGLSYLPSGLFDNKGIERFIRENFERNGMANHFRLLKVERDKDLYIGATNLNTAQAVVFGHDEDCSVTISEAVQASSAIPGFFRPARLNGHDYIDAGVRKTANISQAVKSGAQLIIAYNPFRPFVNYHADQLLNGQRSMSDMGILTVINQAFRTLLHTRLMLGIEKLRLDQSFQGDVILIEPSETDVTFFNLNPLAFWRRAEAAEHGFSSVKEAIERHHEQFTRILARYGISTNLTRLRRNTELIRQANYDADAIIDVLEQRVHDRREMPRRPTRLRVVRGS
ncbi:MAG: patatin-like phospholipase family protein [Myxococcales bacterium]|nr:patatin-like phospholipase family protein [Myxococcales bacterium]